MKNVVYMEFIKLNEKWNAEPNAPSPHIEVEGNTLKLTFALNTFQFQQYGETDKGVLTFRGCRQYRLGPPNDEGFYSYNQSRYKKYGVSWGEFYRVQNSDWQQTFPEDRIVVDESNDPTNLNHYLFYLRDATFECIATDYSFEVVKN